MRLATAIHDSERFVALTPTRYETLKYVCRGLRNKDIALLRGVSIDTVRKDVILLLDKFDVRNRTALAAHCIREDIV